MKIAEMKALLDEIVQLGNELRSLHEHDDLSAVPGKPATQAALAKFTGRHSGKVPPSYLQMLAIYDGIDNFDWVDVSLLNTKFLLSNDDLEESWVETGEYEEGELFIFAQSDSDAHVIAFQTRSAAKNGEMPVVDLDSGGVLGEYENLGDYLRQRRDWFANAIAEEKADRAGLADDE